MLRRNNHGRILLKVGIALIVLAGIAYAAFNSLQKTARVKAAKRDTAVDAVTGSVAVDADGGTNKELKAEADGKVIACDKITQGTKFKEDDVLLELDATELKRRIAEFERNYFDNKRQAHIELTGGKPERLAGVEKLSDEERAKLYQEVSRAREDAARNLAKVKRMHELNSVSDEDLRTAQRALETIDLGLQMQAFKERRAEQDFKTQMDAFDLELERMVIKAPSDGEITEALIWKGAWIGRGHLVGRFMSHDRVVAAKISEESFGRVRLGQKAAVRLLTYGEQSFEATVSKTLPKADEAQRFTVFLDVKVESQELLKPGSTGEVTITVDQHPNAVMVPRLALFDLDKICVVKNGRVEKRQVKPGYINLTEAEILNGVTEGEHVIVDGPQRFRDGDRVRIEVLP
jgi:RND family efflux transporter MFP subunit